MSETEHLHYLTDAAGRVKAVQLSVELWELVAAQVRSAHAELTAKAAPLEPVEPFESFDEFLQYWDFRYAYSPDVCCPQCNAAAADWREGDARPFKLVNANVGGLLVFHCRSCGATVRQKHFRDHRAIECTPKA